MATNTYVELDKVTISGTSTSVVTLNSISSAYTDLVVVISSAATDTSTNNYMYMTFNNDTTQTYSTNQIYGDGSNAGAIRWSNRSNINLEYPSYPSTTQSYHIINILSYSNTTSHKTILCRAGSANLGVDATTGQWRSTAAISRIDITSNFSNFASGSTISLYGITKEPQFSSKATGGTVLYGADGYIYHAFTSSGTFTPNQSLSCQVLVVGGGGGGQSFYSGIGWGSGGDGGYVTYSSSSSFSATPYTVTIGAGGSGGSGTSGASGSTGSTSSVNSITAAGGTGATNGRGPGYGAGGTVSTYRSSPAAGIGVEYLGYKVAGGGWYGQNSQNIADYPVNSTQYGGGFQKGYTTASPSTLPYNGGGGAGGSNSSEGGTSAGQAGAAGLVVIRYAG